MTTLAALLLLIGTVGALVSLIVVHVLPTGLNPLRDPVSQYGISAHRGWYRSAALTAALAGVGAALLFAPLPGFMAFVTLFLLVLFVIGRGLIGFFPMDAPDAPRTSTGRLHNVLAALTFGGVTAAAFTGAGVLHDAGAVALSTPTTVCAVVMALGAIGMLIAARAASFRPFFGLFERFIYVGFLAWFAFLGIAAL